MAALNAPKQSAVQAQLDANDNVVLLLVGQQTNPPAGVGLGQAPGNQPSGGSAGGAQAYLRVPVRLAQGAVPFGIANSGTVAAVNTAGNLTLGTALPTTYSSGIFLYFPATALAAPNNVAGWYFCVMSSTTVGTVYQPLAANPMSTGTIATGSGAGYTGATTAQTVPFLNTTIPASALGANGEYQLQADWSVNNTAGAKTLTIWFNGTSGTTVLSSALTTSLSESVRVHGSNRGATNLQVHSANSVSNNDAGAGIATALTYTSVDTTAAAGVQIAVTLTLATATDVAVLERWHLELIPSASQFGGAS